MKHEFIKDIHYYLDGDRVIFTEKYHIQKGFCCGNKCKHCPFEPEYEKGNVVLANKFLKFKDKIENGDR